MIALAVFAAGCQDKPCGAEPPSSYEVDGAATVPDTSKLVDAEGNLLESCSSYCGNVRSEWVVDCRFLEIVTLEEYGWNSDDIQHFYDKWGLGEPGAQGGQAGASNEVDGPGVVKVACVVEDPGDDLADCD